MLTDISASSRAPPIEQAVIPMNKKEIGVGLYGEKFVWSGKKHSFTNSKHFVEKKKLRGIVTDVLDYRIAEDPVKLLVSKREAAP